MRLVRPASGPQPYADDLDYLQAEVEWVVARCRRIGLQRALDKAVGRDDGEAFVRAMASADGDAPVAMLRRRLARFLRNERHVRADVDARLAVTRAAGRVLALDRMCDLHGLGDIERQILLVAAVPAVSRVLSEALDSCEWSGCASGCLSVDGVLTFVGAESADRVRFRDLFRRHASIVKNDLIRLDFPGTRILHPEDLLGSNVRLATRTFAIMTGDGGLDEEIAEYTTLEQPRCCLDDVVIPDSDRNRIMAAVDGRDDYLRRRAEWGIDDVVTYGRGSLLLLAGPPGTGKTMTAHAIAHRLGLRVLRVDVPTFARAHDAGQFLPGLFRETRLHKALLFFDECECLMASRASGNGVLMAMLLTEIERFDGVAVFATNQPDKLDDALHRRFLVRVDFVAPDATAREQIWRRHLPASAPVAADLDRAALAGIDLTGGRIKNALLAAVAEAALDPLGLGLTHERLLRAAERQASDAMAASGLDVPGRRLQDLVLAPEARDRLEEVVAAMRALPIGRSWGAGGGSDDGGHVLVVSGSAGVGKTACAEAIAGELGRALLQVAIGDRKNLDRAFQAAGNSDIVLVDGHSYGAASPTAIAELRRGVRKHLGLTIIEVVEGDTDLAVPAIWRLDLTLPDAGLRTCLWQKFLHDDVPGADGIDFDKLGHAHELVGGQIRVAAMRSLLAAAASSRQVTMEALNVAARGVTGTPHLGQEDGGP